MAEALTRRGPQVTVLEALPQVMSTVDPQVAAEIRDTVEANGVRVHTDTAVAAIERDPRGLQVHAKTGDGDRSRSWRAGITPWSSATRCRPPVRR